MAKAARNKTRNKRSAPPATDRQPKVVRADRLPEVVPLDRTMSLAAFWDTLEAFNWNYMIEEPVKVELPDGSRHFDFQRCPHMSGKRKHAEIKDIALRRHAEGFAALYLAFEKHHYRHQPKPERPAD